MFTVICGLVYPLVVTGVAQVAFHDKANGSLVKVDGVVVGQQPHRPAVRAMPKYFHPRPSAAGTGYDGLASSCSNLGPTNPDFLKSVEERVSRLPHRRTACPTTQQVPVDAVTASASGLDPDISVANAKLQAPRVADGPRADRRRGVCRWSKKHTTGRAVGLPR